MKESEDEETETKVLFAPTTFYDACDDCDTLPEERWEEFRLADTRTPTRQAKWWAPIPHTPAAFCLTSPAHIVTTTPNATNEMTNVQYAHQQQPSRRDRAPRH